MAGYGTEKVQSTSLNLGFPTAFGKAYARFGEPEVFAPERPLSGLDNTAGMGLQAQWHQQKMRDAHYMANAKVRSTHLANVRAFSSAHNHPNMPHAVLGQRRYANPSFGAISGGNPTREDQHGSPWYITAGDQHSTFGSGRMPSGNVLVGGVLRTSAGQRHGKATLDARIAQLNAIQSAKETFLSEGNAFGQMPRTSTGFAEGTMDNALTSAPLVELANILQNIKDSIIANGGRQATYRDTLQDTTKAFALITRMAVANSDSDIANVLEFIQGNSSGDGILQLLQLQQEMITENGPADDVDTLAWHNRVSIQIEWWGKITEYLLNMIKLGDAPPKSKQLASNAYIKSLGFNKLVRSTELTYRTNVVREDDFIDTTGHVNNPLNAQRAMDLEARAGRSGAFINPGNQSLGAKVKNPTLYTPFDRPGPDPEGFTVQAPRREDTQHGYFGEGGVSFDRSAQESYAYGSGEFLDRSGGRPRAWAGEEVLAEYGESAPDLADDYEEFEQASLANRSVQPPSPPVARIRDPATGEWNVAPPEINIPPYSFGPPPIPESVESSKSSKSSAKPAPSAPPGGGGPKLYKTSDVPYAYDALVAFIHKLEKTHPNYHQAIYKKGEGVSKTKSIRRNTIAKLGKLGLL